MARRVRLTLTVAQALALRDLVLSSDQLNSGDAGDFTPPMARAVAALEDAIEAVRGEFATRLTTRRKDHPTTEGQQPCE